MKGVPSLGEQSHIFSALHKKSFIIFIFVWLSPKRIQISEEESHEVIGWQRGVFLGHGKGVGRVKRGREGLRKERSPPASLPVVSRDHLNANRVLTVEAG